MKLYKVTGLSLALFTSISLAFPNAARSSSPVHLSAGQSTTFPTWKGEKNTRLCIRIERRGVIQGSVQINAGANQEIVATKWGKTTCIERKWGGIMIEVIGRTPMMVWTS
jgi:hypothetical protein